MPKIAEQVALVREVIEAATLAVVEVLRETASARAEALQVIQLVQMLHMLVRAMSSPAHKQQLGTRMAINTVYPYMEAPEEGDVTMGRVVAAVARYLSPLRILLKLWV